MERIIRVPNSLFNQRVEANEDAFEPRIFRRRAQIASVIFTPSKRLRPTLSAEMPRKTPKIIPIPTTMKAIPEIFLKIFQKEPGFH